MHNNRAWLNFEIQADNFVYWEQAVQGRWYLNKSGCCKYAHFNNR